MNKFFVFLSVLFTVFITSHILAATNANEEGKKFAQDMLNSKLAKISTDASNKDLVPNYTDNPPEKALGNNQAALNDKAYEKQATDPNVKAANDMVVNRREYKLDRNKDPLFTNYQGIEQNAAKILENDYQGCQAIPYGSTGIGGQTKSCLANATVNSGRFSCKTEYVKECTNPKAGLPKIVTMADLQLEHIGIPSNTYPLQIVDKGNGVFSIGSSQQNSRGTGKDDCKWYVEQLYINNEEAGTIKQFNIQNLNYDDWIIISVNGAKVIQAVGGNYYAPDGHYPCEQGKTFYFPAVVDIAPKLVQGFNVVRIEHMIGGAGNLSFDIDIKRFEACRGKADYKRTCDAGYNPLDGILKSKACNGTYTTDPYGNRVCQGFTERYEGNQRTSMKEASSCAVLRDRGCMQTAKVCKQTGIDGKCSQEELVFNCGVTSAQKTVSLCGSALICHDGKCTSDVGQEKVDATDDFKNAATKLEVAGQLVKDLNQDKISVFKGVNRQCKDKALGFSNCCKDSGWGNDLGLAQCSGEEKELGIGREDKRTHFVGSYTRGSLLNKTKYQSYCLFSSKLSRILVEQGRQQLRMGWGSARSPDCRGFTMEELGKLDFGKMDLSEYFQDVVQKAQNGTTPSESEASEKIKQTLQDRFNK